MELPQVTFFAEGRSVYLQEHEDYASVPLVQKLAKVNSLAAQATYTIGAFEQSPTTFVTLSLLFCPPVISATPTGRIFVKLDTGDFHQSLSGNSKWLKSDQNIGHFTR
jgi:hypothetical protein